MSAVWIQCSLSRRSVVGGATIGAGGVPPAGCGAVSGGQPPARTAASGKVLLAMPPPIPTALELNQPIGRDR
jgi:hypothetical protein